MDADPIRCRWMFSGRVQGVGFRFRTRTISNQFAVSGWVFNEPDGRVSLEAQGEADELARFLDAIRAEMGPLIVDVLCDQIDPVAGESGFDIRV